MNAALILEIVGAIGVIFIGSVLFVNSIEWLGRKLGVNEKAVGTVLAALGTALPETIVALIAVAFTAGAAAEDIGIGAIMGAPLVLGTVSYAVCGFAVLSRGRRKLHVLDHFVRDDMLWFAAVFAVVVALGFVPLYPLKVLAAIGLVATYVIYVLREFKEEVGGERALAALHFHRNAEDPHIWRVVAQVIGGMLLMVAGAKLFVAGIDGIAAGYQLSALVLAIILAPVATELPEIFNVVIWSRQDKEDLAIGNVSGSMLVQTSLPSALGLVFTSWTLTGPAFVAAAATFVSIGFLYFNLRRRTLTAPKLAMAAVPYLVFLAVFPFFD